ncbi:MAG TPA: hypothetical protein VFX92_09730 [Candidatus Krumholzibacteria bacterium]|nr:hypothetical protein [Candidatus Krumholzibacteria bacterium]
MKTRIGFFALALLVAVPAFAETIYYPPQVTGKRERKNIRHFLYLNNLTNDKKAIYEQYGFTPHRVRLNEYGRVTEKWTYYSVGTAFTFDQCGYLVDTESVSREDRRSWAYQSYGCDEDTHGEY